MLSIFYIDRDGNKTPDLVNYKDGDAIASFESDDDGLLYDFIRVLFHNGEYIVVTRYKIEYIPADGTEVNIGNIYEGDFVRFIRPGQTITFQSVFCGVDVIK